MGKNLTFDIQTFKICHLSVKWLDLNPEQSIAVSIYYRMIFLLENKSLKQ